LHPTCGCLQGQSFLVLVVVQDKPQKVEHFHLGSFHFGEIT
jgi:hypothetical protein